MERSEHPNMQGKSSEQILLEAKPLIDEVKHLVDHDSTFELYVGEKVYNAKELYNELTNLTSFGRKHISSWHYGIEKTNEYAKKKIASVKPVLYARGYLLCVATILLVACLFFRPPHGRPAIYPITGSVIIFIVVLIFFIIKIRELLRYKRLLC